MTIEERRNISQTTIQNLILENREKLSISGVLDVLSFDDQIVMVETELRPTNCKRRKPKNQQTKLRHLRSSSRRRHIRTQLQRKRYEQR